MWVNTVGIPRMSFQSGIGKGSTYDNCGPKCTEVYSYDPRRDYCFTDEDNPGKYCWITGKYLPSGHWKGVTGAGYDDCGPECTDTYDKEKHGW